MQKKYVLVASLFICACAFSQEKKKQKDSISKIEEVIISAKQILGSKFKAQNRTGSAYYISPKEIEKMGYTDINRMLKAVPGVNVSEEDGYGLRPNISLRGTKSERSERISLMEDGVLIAPAPYSAPAAYYFPNAARMYAIEILKGSSQVQYGPFTTGGAINLVSTPIPNKFSGKLNASYGTNNTLKTHFNIGDKKKYFGYMLEYLRYQSDGFKRFEDGEKTGFKRNDFVAKFLLKTDNTGGVNHALELKLSYADEFSKETYVGLSKEDFAKTPFLRYAGSRGDNMQTQHQGLVATYLLQINNKMKFTTDFYVNKFHRNWYKLNEVKSGINPNEKRDIGSILADPEANLAYYNLITGRTDNLGEALILRANNRNYLSRGLQTKFNYDINIQNVKLDIEAGLRYHTDEENRFHWDDSYSIQGGKMSLFVKGLDGYTDKGVNANRITSAKALSTYILTQTKYKNLTITAGLRYEDINLLEKDYTTADTRRSGKIRIETPNKARVLIPSLGINYKVSNSLSLFSGIHKGFAPPGVVKERKYLDRNYNIIYLNDKQKPEESINIEAGLRFNKGDLSAELIGFQNNYSNMLGSDLAATGGLGTLEQFNIGKAVVKGAEFLLQYQPMPKHYTMKLPIQISYTYTDTEMKNTFQSNAWGKVFSGDEIPYIYKHAFNAQLGLEYKWLEMSVGIRHNGDMRTEPGQGTIAERLKIPAHTIIDASAKAKINKNIILTLNAINLTNNVYLASRHPAGLRSGHPLGIFGGVNLSF